MFDQVLNQLKAGKSLTIDQSYQIGQKIFTDASDDEISSFLQLLSAKGETIDELLGMIKAVEENAIKLNINFPVVDIVGTGGDNTGTLNISTASALLVAALDVPVVKHGNRAVSSKCGSADILEALGYKLQTTEDELINNIKTNNFAFCFAAQFHPLFTKVKSVRQKLKIPTIFNLIGPILNPAGIQHVLLGVYTPQKVQLIAETLLALGTKKSLVFHGNGLDELSCLGRIEAVLVTPEGLTNLTIDPRNLGLRPSSILDLSGNDVIYNTSVIYKTLSGIDTPLSDTLILNAAAALFIYGRTSDFETGIHLARERLRQGNVINKNRLLEIIARKMPVLIKRKSLKASIKANLDKAVIGEIKRASPSAGKIAVIDDPVKKAEEYVKAGAAGISVLTDAGFEGSIMDLALVTTALKNTPIPVLCKDFIFSAQQISQAAEAGADAILIMVSVLGNQTALMVQIAHSFGLEALVEVHHEHELSIALNSGADLIGINQRDLRDFSMHPEIFATLINQIPPYIVKIAESGISKAEDANEVFKLGYDGVLVGQALSSLDNPSIFFKDLIGKVEC